MVGPRITVIRIIYPRPLALCNYSRWFSPSYKLWGTRARGYRVGTAERRTKPTPRLIRRPAPGCNLCKLQLSARYRVRTAARKHQKAARPVRTQNVPKHWPILHHSVQLSGELGLKPWITQQISGCGWVCVKRARPTNPCLWPAYETRRQPALIGHPNTSRNDVIICHKAHLATEIHRFSQSTNETAFKAASTRGEMRTGYFYCTRTVEQATYADRCNTESLFWRCDQKPPHCCHVVTF